MPTVPILASAVALSVSLSLAANDWPAWRGPRADGVSTEAGLPERWSAAENIAWKAPLAGVAVSTPIVSGDRVFVTSQVGPGVRRAGNHPRLVQEDDAAALGERALARPAGEQETTAFVVEAFRRSDGARLWQRRIDAEGPLTGVHEKHNLASPSPVTDGSVVFAWFATGQLLALDRDGRIVWQRHLGKEHTPFEISWGHASSPALYGDLLILLCDHAPGAYLLAVDKKTGKDRWKADRGKARASYSTPLIVDGPRGPELIVNSNERIDAYDPQNGAHLWHAGETNRFPIPSPVFHDGVIYASRGYRSGPFMALRPGGRGDVTTTHVLWRVPTGAPYVSSLLHYRGVIYMANDVGVLTAVDAATGERIWQERTGGVFSASPVGGDGKVYFVSENGETIVLRAGRPPTLLARNSLGVRLLASPAVSHGQIFLRSDDQLICIGKPR